MKNVYVVGHQFDCLPAHITIGGRGSGANLQAAIRRAVSAMLKDKRLKHRQIGEFKLNVTVMPQLLERPPKGAA